MDVNDEKFYIIANVAFYKYIQGKMNPLLKESLSPGMYCLKLVPNKYCCEQIYDSESKIILTSETINTWFLKH